MFDLLKKKISNFIGGLVKKEEGKPQAEIPKELIEGKKEEQKQAETKIPEQIAETKKPEPVSEAKTLAQKQIPKSVLPPLPRPEIKKEEKRTEPKKAEEEKKETRTQKEKKEVRAEKENQEEAKKKVEPEKRVPERKEEIKAETKKPELVTKKEIPHAPKEKERKQERKPGINLGLAGHIKGLVFGEIEIQKSDISELLDGLEMDLLESDVSFSVAEEVKRDLEKQLVGMKVRRGDVSKSVRDTIKSSLIRISGAKHGTDVVEFARNSEKPVPIIFLGVNGAGKTTTIAKFARLLMDNGLKVVFSASDTFRAAAIEQMEVHGNRLGVRVIKRPYGSDPTAVAFDAVNHAKASSIDVVLIDTAGRQETNQSLMAELKKMVRVIQPRLKLYIGESIAGSAIIDQVIEFNKELGGIDGVILTKLDCDAKGGAVISIPHATGVPISYIGTGQQYSDLEKFDAGKIVGGIVEGD